MHNAYVPANCECETSFREWIHFVVAPRRIESFELNKQQAQATSRSGGIDRAEEGCSSKREDHLSLSLSLEGLSRIPAIDGDHDYASRSVSIDDISARCNEVTYFLMIEGLPPRPPRSLTPNCHGNCSTVVKSKYTVRRNGRIPLTPNVSRRDCSYSRVKISVERTVGRVGKIRERLSIGEKV